MSGPLGLPHTARDWLFKRIMGAHLLWLFEGFLEVLPLRPGMRGVDLARVVG